MDRTERPGNERKRTAIRTFLPFGEMRKRNLNDGKYPVDNGKTGCYSGKVFFGMLLGGGLRPEPQSDNRTDERHRGSQLKVPKETGTFSRKMSPSVFFI